MPGTVLIRRIEPDLWRIAPPDAPTVLDPAPALDTTVLEVLGGHLSWSLLSGQRLPAAILHDLSAAQDWLWAIYGAPVAVAANDYTEPVELSADPHLPETATAARRLAYAHWAARWWPASALDGIPALDQHLLDDEIATLTAECDLLVDGDDATAPVRELAAVPATARAEDYALAAGALTGDQRGALTFGRGSGGWDWRRCPPGLVDASEQAVSWELTRAGGVTVVRVRAVAAPGLTGEVPGHLRPHALIATGDGIIDTELALFGDTWAGSAETHSEVSVRVDIHVPGVGPVMGPGVRPGGGPATGPGGGPATGPGGGPATGPGRGPGGGPATGPGDGPGGGPATGLGGGPATGLGGGPATGLGGGPATGLGGGPATGPGDGPGGGPATGLGGGPATGPGSGPAIGPATGPGGGPATGPGGGPATGPGSDRPTEPETRARIRAFAAERLRRAAESDTSATGRPAGKSPTGVTGVTGVTGDAGNIADLSDTALLAEIAAAAEDSDF